MEAARSCSLPARVSLRQSTSSSIAHRVRNILYRPPRVSFRTAWAFQLQPGRTTSTWACSGYVYGLGQAEGLIATGQASNVLLITSDTYSKFIHPLDRSVRTISGMAPQLRWCALPNRMSLTLGRGCTVAMEAERKICWFPPEGCACPRTEQTAVASEDAQGNVRSADNLFMDGGEIFNFTLARAPCSVERLLAKAGLSQDAIDLFVFHQTNTYTLDIFARN